MMADHALSLHALRLRKAVLSTRRPVMPPLLSANALNRSWGF
jgi:hypothetical protein